MSTAAMPSSTCLAERHDAVLLDLDGVVYRGDRAVPRAPEVLEELRARRIPLLFLTNNSARTPEEVAGGLRGLGVPARPEEILTSSLATAAMLGSERPRPSTAFVVGERGIREALEGIGVRMVQDGAEGADLVVVGWDRGVDYAKLRTAALLVERGARLIGTNPDASYPAPDGLWPGAGALLSAVVTTTGVTPTVVGKPAAPMFRAAAERLGATHPLVVGDRLDTDVAGAAGVGWDSLLVLTGASTVADLPRASVLPTYLGRDVSTLLDDPPPARPRRAEASDGAEVVRLLTAAGLDASGAPRHLDATTVLPGADGLLAMAAVRRVDGDAVLRSVAVREDVRNARLGTLVVAAALARARAEGIRTVAAFTTSAAPFFERLGFRVADRATLPQAVREAPDATGECATATALVASVQA